MPFLPHSNSTNAQPQPVSTSPGIDQSRNTVGLALVAVLAHEVGHFKKRHIFSGLIMSIIQIGVMTFFFELCLKLPEISLALGGSEASFHLGLIGFSIIFSPISMLSGILMNYIQTPYTLLLQD